MSDWVQILIIGVALTVSVWYLYKRIRASVKGKDSLDCPYADDCCGCNCKKPELKDKCGMGNDDAGCGCN